MVVIFHPACCSLTYACARSKTATLVIHAGRLGICVRLAAPDRRGRGRTHGAEDKGVEDQVVARRFVVEQLVSCFRHQALYLGFGVLDCRCETAVFVAVENIVSRC